MWLLSLPLKTWTVSAALRFTVGFWSHLWNDWETRGGGPQGPRGLVS